MQTHHTVQSDLQMSLGVLPEEGLGLFATTYPLSIMAAICIVQY